MMLTIELTAFRAAKHQPFSPGPPPRDGALQGSAVGGSGEWARCASPTPHEPHICRDSKSMDLALE